MQSNSRADQGLAASLRRLGIDRPAQVPSAVLAARQTLAATLVRLGRVRDQALTTDWRWQDGQIELRYAFYRLLELFEAAAATLERAAAAGPPPTRAGLILAQANRARWDLHGVLIPLTDADLDRDPGGGEWTLRRTLGHVVTTQARYLLSTRYAVDRVRAADGRPIQPPAEALPARQPTGPDDAGSLAEIRARLDELVDVGMGLMVDVDDETELAGPTDWAGFAVTVRFRLHRWTAHLREHTIQAEKILAGLRREPGEVERLVRIICGGYGELEAAAWLLSPERAAGSAGASLTAAVGEAAAIATTLPQVD